MKDICNEKVEVKLEEEILVDGKNGDSLLISTAMVENEEKLLEARLKEEEAELKKEPDESANLNDTQFTKLDELLTKTQMFSEFLLEKMDDIMLVLFRAPFNELCLFTSYSYDWVLT